MADLGTLWSVESSLSQPSIPITNGTIVTNILNTTLANREDIGSTLGFAEQMPVVKGIRIPSLLSPIKPNPFNNAVIENKDAYSIAYIVPGPVANIEAGIQIGYNKFTDEINRIYPPIYINYRPEKTE